MCSTLASAEHSDGVIKNFITIGGCHGIHLTIHSLPGKMSEKKWEKEETARLPGARPEIQTVHKVVGPAHQLHIETKERMRLRECTDGARDRSGSRVANKENTHV